MARLKLPGAIRPLVSGTALLAFTACAPTPAVTSAGVARSVPACTDSVIGISVAPDVFVPPASISAALTGTPYHHHTVEQLAGRPALGNRDDVNRALRESYPRDLRDSGRGGTVVVLFVGDTAGAFVDASVLRRSQYSALDRASLRVAATMRFEPPQRRGCRTPFAAVIPLVWQSR